MKINDITQKVLECSYEIHSKLGSGSLEKVYRECLAYELKKAGLLVKQEKPMALIYEEVKLDCGYRIDILVEKK